MVTLQDTIFSISSSRKQRFLKAQATLRKAVGILVGKYHVSKIVLIGSLADKQRFGFHSDIDLCVEGLPDNLYFEAVGELLLTSDEFDIDIIPLENVSPGMSARVKKGKVLYEKG